jgi:hypothetical protein
MMIDFFFACFEIFKVMNIWILRLIALLGSTVIISMIAAPDSLAVPGDISVRDVSEGRHLSLAELKGKFRLYNARAAENPEAAEDLRKFLRKRFEIEILPPDDMSYDLVTNTLNVSLDFPLKVMRRRGTEFSAANLLIFAPLERPKGRKMLANREQVYLRLMFHLNSRGEMVIDDLRMFFRGEEVYSD